MVVCGSASAEKGGADLAPPRESRLHPGRITGAVGSHREGGKRRSEEAVGETGAVTEGPGQEVVHDNMSHEARPARNRKFRVGAAFIYNTLISLSNFKTRVETTT